MPSPGTNVFVKTNEYTRSEVEAVLEVKMGVAAPPAYIFTLALVSLSWQQSARLTMMTASMKVVANEMVRVGSVSPTPL